MKKTREDNKSNENNELQKMSNLFINWSPFAYADLQYIIEMTNKSILSKLEDRQIVENLKKFQKKLHTQVQETDVNGYFWIMMIINRLLDDDHSSIKLNNLQQIQTLDFCGLVFDSKIIDNKLHVFVCRSFLKDINIGDELVKINDQPVIQFINKNSKKYIKQTYSPITNIKKYILYMCLMNPFDPIQSIEILQSNIQQVNSVNIIKETSNSSKRQTKQLKQGVKAFIARSDIDQNINTSSQRYNVVQGKPLLNKYKYKKTSNGQFITILNLQYYKANQRYFQGYDNIFDLMRQLLIEDEKRVNQLDITTLKQGKMLYYDIHQFLSFGDNIQKIEQSIQQLISPEYEWIVIDLRNNAGGSVYLTLLLSSYLFDPKIVKQYKDCQIASFNLNHEFLTKYNEQYIIPVIADPGVSPQIKQKFIQMQQYLLKKQQSLFLNTKTKKSTIKTCNKDILSSYNKQISKYILNNISNEDNKLQKSVDLNKTLQKNKKKQQQSNNNEPFKKIVLITNLHCYSACVHTYNFMRLFPNVVTIGHQIGKTTGSGNSIQMQLPSQQAHVILPQLYVSNINLKFNESMQSSSQVDVLLDTDILLSKQALIVFILENKQNLLEIIKKRANNILNFKNNLVTGNKSPHAKSESLQCSQRY